MLLVIATTTSCKKESAIAQPPPSGGGSGTPTPIVKTPNFNVSGPAATQWFNSNVNFAATPVSDVDSLWAVDNSYTFSGATAVVTKTNVQEPSLTVTFKAKNGTGGSAEKSATAYFWSQPRTGLCQTSRFLMSVYTIQVVGSSTVTPLTLVKDTFRFATNDSVYTSLFGGTGFEYKAKYSLINEWTPEVSIGWDGDGSIWVIDWVNESGWKEHIRKPSLNNPNVFADFVREFRRVN